MGVTASAPCRSRHVCPGGQTGGAECRSPRPFKPGDRPAWRAWLERNHRTASETWLLLDDRPEEPTVSYLDAVEEAICFGWIDGIQKRFSTNERAQRFTPRKPPEQLDGVEQRACSPADSARADDRGRAGDAPRSERPAYGRRGYRGALQAEPDAWPHFLAFPISTAGCAPDMSRRRVGIGEFERRLCNFVRKTASNQMFGNWNDGGRLG